jgi:hypothetical protein
VVHRSQVGTAYGLLTALQNCGLFLTPLLVSMVYDRTSMVNPANPYAGVESLFACQVTCHPRHLGQLPAPACTRHPLGSSTAFSSPLPVLGRVGSPC